MYTQKGNVFDRLCGMLHLNVSIVEYLWHRMIALGSCQQEYLILSLNSLSLKDKLVVF